MNWLNVCRGNGTAKMIYSDDMARTGSMIVFDFRTEVSIPEVLSAMATLGLPYRYLNVLNPQVARQDLFGDKPQEDQVEQDEPSVFDAMSWREWFAYPVIKTLDRMIRWCYGPEKSQPEADG